VSRSGAGVDAERKAASVSIIWKGRGGGMEELAL
jgi:hypothetical protein